MGACLLGGDLSAEPIESIPAFLGALTGPVDATTTAAPTPRESAPTAPNADPS
jgi:hypothetical protein